MKNYIEHGKGIIMKGKLILFLFIAVALTSNAQTYATGNYSGTGIARSITGLGFSPECVIIKSSSSYEAVIRTSDMDAGEVKGLGTGNTACYTGAITSLDANGFTIGTGNTTNNASSFYHWIAFNEGTNISVGTYTGNNDWSSEVVSGMGFSPDAMLIWGDVAAAHGNPAMLLSVMGAGSDDGFFTHTNGTTAAADYISTWGADGFTTGGTASSTIWNANYFYIAFNESGTTIKENSYTGNGSDNRSVTDMGFQPDFTVVWSYNVGVPVFRHTGIMSSADKSLVFTATTSASNLIQSFAASGLTVGNDSKVNSNSIVHYYFATSGGQHFLCS